MNGRYIKMNIIVLIFISVLVGCNGENSKNYKSTFDTETFQEDNDIINSVQEDNSSKDNYVKPRVKVDDEDQETLETFKVIESKKDITINYDMFKKQYANLSDDIIDMNDWWLYTECEHDNKPYIYRFNTKTGNKIRVCEGNIERKKLLQDKIYYANESGIKLLYNNQKINLINKPLDKYQKIKDGYIYIISNTLYHFNTLTNTESILDTFNNPIIGAKLTADSNDDEIIYCIKTEDEISVRIYNINTRSNKTILENQFCNNIISCGDKIFLFIDSDKTIYVYEDDKIKELVTTAYPTKNEIIYYDDRMFFASDMLYILDVNTYSIKAINTYSSKNRIIDLQGQDLYIYGRQLMLYDIEHQKLENKNIFLDLDMDINIDSNSIIQVDNEKDIIKKMDFDGNSYSNSNLGEFMNYFIGDDSIYLVDDRGIISLLDKDNLEKLNVNRKYDNSYIYQVVNKDNKKEFRIESYDASVHLNNNTYYPSSNHTLINLISDKNALEKIGIINSDWYDYNNKFITYVNEEGTLYYYNRYTKERKSLKVKNVNNLRVINNTIYYYSIDDKALFCYKNNRHSKIVDGNINKYEVLGNKVYYEDDYLYRVDKSGNNKEKLNNSLIKMLIKIKDNVFYINNEDINALYKINNNTESSELINIIPALTIDDYFTDDEKLYIYYLEKDKEVIKEININNLEFTDKLYENENCIIFNETLQGNNISSEIILGVYDKKKRDCLYYVRWFGGNQKFNDNYFYFTEKGNKYPSILRIDINNFNLEEIYECTKLTIDKPISFVANVNYLAIEEIDSGNDLMVNIYDIKTKDLLNSLNKYYKLGFLIDDYIYYISEDQKSINKYNIKENINETVIRADNLIQELYISDDTIYYGTIEDLKIL
ncbi:hypothetical protein SH1V18_34850 [Vallitalea longa]|uniref:DUF5050 domain-containing protein n=1 Tax=Vallitalea longa TaxID=2936439 RepID=A0A9W6DFW5_9FIRM|nr:DUF5050 domain-containing protein [Vallitalea longa]GKX31005.1 hypothetical protein SH1V18_34850 [Vallitalea longa]